MRSKPGSLSLTKAICLSVLLIMTNAVNAQDWPNRQIQILVGFAPGGTTDMITRLVAQRLQESLGVPVVVENRPGAGGNVAAAYLARAAANDHAFMVVSPSALSINQYLYKSIGFDPDRDFSAVGLIAHIPNAIVVNSSVQARTFKELIEYAKANPNKLNYSSAGIGTTGHLLNELLKTQTGIEVMHVPYKGDGPSLQGLLAGDVQFTTSNNLAQSLPLIREGKLRPLAITAEKRWFKLPNVPTVAELGFPALTTTVWFGLVTQSKTSKAVVERMNREINAALARPDMIARLNDMNFEAMPGTPEVMSALIRRERERWKKVVEASGARAE